MHAAKTVQLNPEKGIFSEEINPDLIGILAEIQFKWCYPPIPLKMDNMQQSIFSSGS